MAIDATIWKGNKGIYKLRTGEILVRARVLDQSRGKYRDSARKLPADTTEQEAKQAQLDLLAQLSHTGPIAPAPARTRFSDFARKVMNDRIALGKIASPETKAKWENTLAHHLEKKWGDVYIDAIRRTDVEQWLVSLGTELQAGKWTPSTVATWWTIFRTIMTRAAVHFDTKDATLLLESPTTTYRMYTDEEPNSLLPSELPAFFDAAWKYEREHFAMLALGMLTGRRACELRPLRREGKPTDLDWSTGRILIRRSQTIGAAMDVTKTKKDVTIWLPESFLDILRTHVANLTPYKRSSPLLFPPGRRWLKDGTGGPAERYMSKSALDKPLRNICAKMNLGKRLTAKGAMRRTYQDLCRAAEVKEFIQMAMSGHATKEMAELYSSAAAEEKRTAVSRMFGIAGLKEAARL